jgi:flagellar biosynthesis protein FlhG
MHVPTSVAHDRVELLRALDSAGDVDLVLVDTAGRSNPEAAARQAKLLRTVPGLELHLVVAANQGHRDLAAIAEQYRSLGPEEVLVTKTDEAAAPAGVRHRQRPARPRRHPRSPDRGPRQPRARRPAPCARREEVMDQADALRKLVEANGPRLRVVGVTSGKGGVGKTNLTANLAVLAAQSGLRVLIIDADLGLANVEILYGLSPRYHLGHLLDASVSLDQVLVRGPHGIRVLPAGSGIQTLTRLDDAQKLHLVAALDPLEDSFDLVIIDSGAGIGDNVLFFVGAAQQALLVVSPEPTSMTDAYAAVKVLSQQGGVRIFDVVVNQVPTELAARDIFQRLVRVTDRFLDTRVRFLGHVPRDENVHRAVMAQKPLVDLFPHSPASRAMAAIAARMLDEPAPVVCDGGLLFLWQRLFRESSAVAV